MPALIEKPKMTNAMYESLKTHILRERQRKKQEQEQDAAIERLRREREYKQKRDVMTLEETKEQIVQLEEKLKQQRDDKHQLFLQLKKVLNEDETRRKARETSDLLSLGHFTIGAPNVFLQTGPISARNLMYKSGPPPTSQQTLIPAGTLKRPRSPSPPYNYKIQTNYVQKQYQSSQQQQQQHYYASSQPHSASSSSYQTGSQPGYNYPVHGPFQPGGPMPGQSPQGGPQPQSAVVEPPPKHMPHGYHIQHVQPPPAGYMAPMHQALDHPSKAPFTEEKYYGVPQHTGLPLRGITGMHPQTLISIQQQPKPGGITSGYPIRSQPPSSVAYSVTTSAPQHNAYNAPPGAPRHGYTNQPPPGSYY